MSLTLTGAGRASPAGGASDSYAPILALSPVAWPFDRFTASGLLRGGKWTVTGTGADGHALVLGEDADWDVGNSIKVYDSGGKYLSTVTISEVDDAKHYDITGDATGAESAVDYSLSTTSDPCGLLIDRATGAVALEATPGNRPTLKATGITFDNCAAASVNFPAEIALTSFCVLAVINFNGGGTVSLLMNKNTGTVLAIRPDNSLAVSASTGSPAELDNAPGSSAGPTLLEVYRDGVSGTDIYAGWSGKTEQKLNDSATTGNLLLSHFSYALYAADNPAAEVLVFSNLTYAERVTAKAHLIQICADNGLTVAPIPLSGHQIVSITNSGGKALVTTAAEHGLTMTPPAQAITGSSVSGYNQMEVNITAIPSTTTLKTDLDYTTDATGGHIYESTA